jgi:predicted GNAT superfamily acetyltransferase
VTADGSTPQLTIRNIEPSDHARVVAVLDDWWGGRQMTAMLPKLFFVHFRPTSFVLERDGELAGFLCGFVSQTDPTQAYVHFVGVDPRLRGQGAGRLLYDRFFDAVRERGCTVVRAVTSPVNTGSVAFHTAIGFEAEPEGGESYDGPGEDRVRFVRRLAPPEPPARD